MTDNSDTVVLVADDEPSTLALVAEHARSKGFKVIEASDGDMAWQLAHQHLPDLVILDVMMPGMSGWEVCRKIRESLPLAHTGVIMLTGIGQNLNEMTSPLYGADTHVDKPFEFGDLDEKIELTLKDRRKGTYGRADHADEEPSSPVQAPPSLSNDEAPLTAPTGGRIVAKVKVGGEGANASEEVPAAKPAHEKAAKKAPTKKAASKETSAKKAPAKKATSKKVPKKAPAKKATKKTSGKKSPAKKTVSQKVRKKATAKKASASKATKKTPAKKSAAKKYPAKKSASKKVAKKSPAKKALGKKTPSKKVAKKSPAKKRRATAKKK
jgi:CheY-like chemotaxis protein